MYTNDVAVKSCVTTESKETMLSYYHNRFQKLNEMQSGFLNSMADRLHDILDKRSPDIGKEPGNSIDNPIVDYAQKIDREIQKLEQNTHRLEHLLYHLNEIV